MSRQQSKNFGIRLDALLSGGTLTGLGEGQLLERFLTDRDDDAFEELVARHGPMILGICGRLLDDPQDIEDAFQATFLILLRKAASLRDRDSVSNWLFGVALRVARRAQINSRRRKSRERPGELEAAANSTTIDALANREAMMIVDHEIGRLPKKQQAAVVLCLVQGRTHDAAARELGWPIGTVKSRLASARFTLASRLRRRGLAPSVVVGLDKVADRFLAVPLPDRIAQNTIAAALQSVAGPSIQHTLRIASARTLMAQVLRAHWISQLKILAVVAAAVGALAWAAPAFLASRPEVRPDARSSHAAPNVPRIATGLSKRDLYGDPLPQGASLRLGTTRHRQESPIHRIAYSPDGKYVVTDADDGTFRIWSSDGGHLIRRVAMGESPIHDFAFSRDARLLVGGDIRVDFAGGMSVAHCAVTDLDTGRMVSERSWVLSGSMPWSVALSHDCQLIAIGKSDGTLTVLDSRTGAELSTHHLHTKLILSITFSQVGDRFAAVGSDLARPEAKGELFVFDTQLKRELWSTPLRSPDVRHVAFSPDGSMIAVLASAVLEYRDSATGNHIPTPIFKGKSLAFARKANTFYPSNPTTRRVLDSLESGNHQANFAALSPDGRTVASDGGPTVLHVWDVKTQVDLLASPGTSLERIDSVVVSPDGRTLYTGSADMTARVWDLTTGRELKSMGHQGAVRTMCLSRDGALLVTGTARRCGLYQWDLANAKAPTMIEATADILSGRCPLALTISKNDNAITACWSDGTMKR
jgi:RNA polymerase sigma factor (sigma-70 family)